jgi:hypothetical protein
VLKAMAQMPTLVRSFSMSFLAGTRALDDVYFVIKTDRCPRRGRSAAKPPSVVATSCSGMQAHKAMYEHVLQMKHAAHDMHAALKKTESMKSKCQANEATWNDPVGETQLPAS